jgi:hypothetical protein
MKSFVLLCLIGLAAATVPTWQWQTGKEHIFEYSGRILSGMPELSSSHFSGVGIKCDVSIQVKSMEDLRLTLRNVRFSHVNGPLATTESTGYTGANWRTLVLPGFTPASQDVKQLLSMPLSFSVRDGEIKAVTVSGAEQQWSLNFKKALVVMFQTKMEKSSLDLEMNTIVKDSYETKNYWKVSEETIEGVCDVIYQINELPSYFVKENPESFPRLTLCSSNPSPKYFEITKTKDLQSCKQNSIYSFMKPAMTNGCTSPRCVSQLFGAASSITRYYACGSRSELVLQVIENEGEADSNIFGYKGESLVTGTKQVFKLKEITPITHEVPKPTQPRTIESVSYEYVPAGETLRNQVGLVPKIPQSELKNAHVYKYLPRHYLPNPNSQETKERLSPEKVKTELKTLFTTVIHDIKNPEDIHTKEIPLKLMSIVRAFTLLKSEEMKSLYTDLKGQFTTEQEMPIFQNIFFDAVTVSGTTPAVMFLKEMIRTQEMTKTQAVATFMLLPHHIITPTTEVFSSLFELINSEVVQKSSPLYNTAVMSFSNLIQKACLADSRKTLYPVDIFGEFCDPQSEIVTEKWIPYLTHALKTAEHTDRRNLIVMALGVLSHKDVVPTLLPVVEGTGPVFRPEYTPRSEYDYRNVTRYLSIFALGNSGHKHPEIVLPVLYSIFNNPAENTEVRIAAFTTMMNMNPPVVYLQKVATMTWSEKDSEVLKSVSTYIHSLATQSQIVPLETSATQSNLVKKCQLILPLMKPSVHMRSIPSTGTLFVSDTLPMMNVAYKGVTSWISNYKSVIPSSIYSRIEYLLGGYQFKPFEIGFKLHGAENLYQNFNEIFNPSAFSGSYSVWKMTQSELDSVLNSLPAELRSKIVELPQEHKQKILSLPEPSIRKFCELSMELKQKVLSLNQYEVRKVLSISSQEEIVRILNLPEPERRSILEKLTTIGGRYNSESRRQSIEEEEYRHLYGQTGQSTTGTEGMSHSGLNHFNKQFSQIKDQLHTEWAKVIDQLKIESRENGPLSTLAFINLFDDMSLFGSISELTTERLHQIITPILMNPGHYKTKVCGKTPFSLQRFLNIAPTEILRPSDMGFPIIMQVHAPTTFSISGHVNIDCDVQAPSLTVDTKVFAMSNMHGSVGTFCPFSKQMVLTGIKQERIINVPVKTHVKFDAISSKVKIVMTPLKTTKPIDIVYSSNMPYTAAKSYYNLRPMSPSTSTYKHIKSPSPVRKTKIPFGSILGLNLKAVVETESRYLDTTYIMQLAKMYNYNPMNLIRFFFTPTVSEYGYSSFRRHEFRIQYDPSNSATNEIETTLAFGVATKYPEEAPKYHSISIKSLEELQNEQSIVKKLNPYTITSHLMGEQVHTTRQGLLQKILIEKLQLRSGAGISFQLTTVLKGSRPRTFSYQILAGAGINMQKKQTWDIELQTEPSSPSVHQKICIHGYTQLPSVPTWDIDMIRSTNMDFQVHNTIGYGRTCEESKIIMIGNYKVSPQQKSLSKESPAARECEKLIQRQVPGAITSPLCEETKMLAQMVDQIDYKIRYVNIAPTVTFFESKVVSGLKAFLWPYISHDETFVSTSPSTHSQGQNKEVLVRLQFQPTFNTFDLSVIRPEERVTFRHIRNTYPILSSMIFPVGCEKCPVAFPLLGAATPCKPSIARVLGHDNSVCRIEKSWLTTFDNKTMPLKMDDCFHLVTGDCSSTYRFGVLARSVGHSQNKEIKIYLNKTEVVMTPSSSYSKYSREVRITVNGTEIHLEKESRKIVRDESHVVVFELYKTKDSVIEFSSPLFSIYLKFNGERLDLESSLLLKSKLCGICGDYNNQKIADVAGPKKCVYSTPELKIASYRVNSPQCSALEGSIKERLETETQQCAKYKEIPTEVFKSFMALVGKCSRHEHMILERVNEICFSRVPVTQCGAQCSPKPRQLVSKKISFTCMKTGRIAELYREKVIQGQELPELKQKPESFSTSILVPQSCVSVISGLPMIYNSGIPSSVPTGPNGVPTQPQY